MTQRIRNSTRIRRPARLYMLAVGLLLAGLLTISCEYQVDIVDNTGMVDLNFDERVSALLLQPEVSLEIVTYKVTGSGPSESTFYAETEESSMTVSSLEPGDWTFSVDGVNSEGEVVGTGTTETTVLSGEITFAEAAVEPLPGNGHMDVLVSWPEGALTDPVLSGQLISRKGSIIDLTFVVTSGTTARSFTENVHVGKYTLAVQLFDGGMFAADVEEEVRIASRSTTSGEIVFTDVQSADESVSVTFVVDMNDPLTVGIMETTSMVNGEETVTMVANVLESAPDVTYEWYLDGVPIGIGETCAIPADLAAGAYRFDVVALSGDTSSSGSISHTFNVVDP